MYKNNKFDSNQITADTIQIDKWYKLICILGLACTSENGFIKPEFFSHVFFPTQPEETVHA